MTTLQRAGRAGALLAMLLGAGIGAAAQPGASYRNGSEFYLAYRLAFDQATSIDELLPWVAKGRAEQIAGAPASERREAFAMIKMFDDRTNIRVVRETPSSDGAELLVEGVSAATQGKATGVITLVKEGGAWKIERESWKGGMGR